MCIKWCKRLHLLQTFAHVKSNIYEQKTYTALINIIILHVSSIKTKKIELEKSS